ncbi:MAG TPA: tetratricopeptide repeat protein, partial [Streptomyces sp.]|nr:tetratricopeptide repeat protein [Streptomyces sp.]
CLTIAEEGHRRELGGHFSIVHSEVERRPVDPDLLEELLVQPLEWFEAERLCLVAVVAQAARAGLAGIAWDVTVSTAVLFETRNYTENWRECAETALASARAAGDLRGQGAALENLGAVALRLHSMDDALVRFEEALRLFRAAGEELGRALTLRNLSMIHRLKGEAKAGEECLSEALPIFRAAGDLSSEASCLQNMAQLALDRGDAAAASELGLNAVRVSESMGAGGSRNLAQALYRVAHAQLALGRCEEAEASFLRVERLVLAKSDTHGLAHALFGLGLSRSASGASGATESAEAAFVEARKAAQLADGPVIEGQIRLRLGQLLQGGGRTAEAAAELRAARDLFTRSGAARWQTETARALEGLGG